MHRYELDIIHQLDVYHSSPSLVDIGLELGHRKLDRPSHESLRPKLVNYVEQLLAYPISLKVAMRKLERVTHSAYIAGSPGNSGS